jgi:DNA replication and repair protein RecF
VRDGSKAYSIRALFRDQGERTNTISVVYNEGKKRIEKNAKQIVDRKELVNTIPCILFSHDDLDFASGEPERRRFFIDQSLSMYDNTYIDVMRNYKKILKTRNSILRDKRIDLLDVIDSQLAETGVEVVKRRLKTIFDFNRVFARLYNEVTGIEDVHIDYAPAWKKMSSDEILGWLIEKRTVDIEMGTTMSGPHRDRIRFSRKNYPFVPTASTGQRRLLSLLLRTAQASFYTELTGRLPVLLMDDVMLELDPDKRQKFFSVLPKYDQLFCTFLPGEPYEKYKTSNTRIYYVDRGSWNE